MCLTAQYLSTLSTPHAEGAGFCCLSATPTPSSKAKVEEEWALEPELSRSDASIGTVELQRVRGRAGAVVKSFTAMGLDSSLSSSI